MMGKRTVIFGGVVLCAAGLGAWMSLRSQSSVQYRTATVQHGEINVTISATGNPNAVVTVQVGSLEWPEMEERHRLTFETHEEGKLAFEEYSDRVIFYKKRPFTRAQFRRFTCS